jgi:hypothetical protein
MRAENDEKAETQEWISTLQLEVAPARGLLQIHSAVNDRT